MKQYLKSILAGILSICIIFSVPGVQLCVKAVDSTDVAENTEKNRIEKLFMPENEKIVLNEKKDLEEIRKSFPEVLEAQFENETQKENVPVLWECRDDYAGTNYDQYTFDPIIDNTEYEFSDNFDESELPYIEVVIIDENKQEQDLKMSGNGALESPYMISSLQDLKMVSNDLSGNYELVSDIDLSEDGGVWIPIGTEETPFSGTFNGAGHDIYGLKSFSQSKYEGIFGYAKNAKIENVTVIMDESSAIYTDGAKAAGLILGYGVNTNITACNASGKLLVDFANQSNGYGCAFTGGIVGYLSGSVNQCFSQGEFQSVFGWDCDGHVGGIAGELAGDVIDCYAISNLRVSNRHNGEYSGGLVGWMKDHKIINSYAISWHYQRRWDSNYDSGLFGNPYGTVVKNSYYNKETLEMVNVTGECEKTSDELKKRDTYNGWDFENVWEINPSRNGGYPYLKTQSQRLMYGCILDDPILNNVSPNKYELAKEYCDGTSAEGYTLIGNEKTIVLEYDRPIKIMDNKKLYCICLETNANIPAEFSVKDENKLCITISGLVSKQHYKIIVEKNAIFGTGGGSSKGNHIAWDRTYAISDIPMDGKGTEESPYLITTPEQLDAVRYELFSCYQLQNDIDLWEYKRSGWKPIGDRKHTFSGTFDGNGYRIVGLKNFEGSGETVLDTGIEPRGFFSCVQNATIANLGIAVEEKNKFNGTAQSTSFGLLVGKGTGRIINCYAIGDVYTKKGIAVGLLAGIFSGEINRCWSKGSLDSTDPWWESSGRVSAGGIVGEAEGNIINCYSICDIKANVQSIVSKQTSYVGGIVGKLEGAAITIEDSYYVGSLLTSVENDNQVYRVGGIIGCFEYSNPDMSKYDISNCYYNSDTTGITSETDSNMISKLGIPKTTDEMKSGNTYENWDFENVWQMGTYMNDGYPYFRNTEKFYVNREEIVISYEELFIDYPRDLDNVVTDRILEKVWNASTEAQSIYSNGEKDAWLAGQYVLYEDAFYITINETMKMLVQNITKYLNLKGLYYAGCEDEIIDQVTAEIVKELGQNENVLGEITEKCGEKYSTIKKIADLGNKISKKEWTDYVVALKIWDKKTSQEVAERLYSDMDNTLEKFSGVMEEGIRIMRAFQMASTVLWTISLSEEVIADIKNRIRKGTDLYVGLQRLEDRAKDPTGTALQYTINFTAHECAKAIADGVEEALFSLIFSGAGKGILKIGKAAIQGAIDASVYAKADDYVKAVTYAGASTFIRGVSADIKCQYIRNKKDGVRVTSGKLSKDMQDYQTYFNLYIFSLNRQLDLMKGISKSRYDIIRRIEAAKALIEDYDCEQHLQFSLRQAEKGWRLKYTKRDGKIAIAGNANDVISVNDVHSASYADDAGILFIPGELQGNPVKTILPYAFASDSSVKMIVIDEGVEEISEGAFADCPNLKHVLLPNSLKTIKAGAFANCEQITDIELPERIESIDNTVFDNNDNLTIYSETHSKAADFARAMDYELIEIESRIASLDISSYPDKTEFSSDEEIDLSGLELLVTYMNGEQETITDNWVILDGLLKEDPTVLQVQYMEKRVSVPITLHVKEHEYCIEYMDIYGNELANKKTGTASFGEKIEEVPISIPGYTAQNEIYNFIVDGGDNIFSVIYDENEKLYLEKGGMIEEIQSQKETGKEITPEIIVKYKGQILTKDKDYMIIYTDNIKAGNATALAVGINEYDGVISKEFLIEKSDSSAPDNQNPSEEPGQNEENVPKEPSDHETDGSKQNDVNDPQKGADTSKAAVDAGDDGIIVFWLILAITSMGIGSLFIYKRCKKGRN